MSEKTDEEMSAEAEAFATETLTLLEMIHPLLAGRGAIVQGAVLADLLATWLGGHLKLNDDDTIDWDGTAKLREGMLDMHLVAVRDLLANDDTLRDKPQ